MKIKLTSVFVDDQDKALRFYTDVLGFAKKTDFSQGSFRWLTVGSPEEPDGTQLQLALNDNPAARRRRHGPNALRFPARRLGRLYFDYFGDVRPAERMAARYGHCQSATFEDTRHRLCRVRNQRRNPGSD